MKTVLLALGVFAAIGVPLTMLLLSQFGFERNYLYIAGGALVITSLVTFRRMALIIIILLLCLAINLPQETLSQYYLDRDILIVVVVLMVIFPLVYREFVGKK